MLSQTTSTPCKLTIWRHPRARAASAGCTSSVSVPPVLRLGVVAQHHTATFGRMDLGVRSWDFRHHGDVVKTDM
jgi:hypothetical protein